MPMTMLQATILVVPPSNLWKITAAWIENDFVHFRCKEINGDEVETFVTTELETKQIERLING